MTRRVASSKVRIAIAGLGHWGPNLLRSFSRIPEVELVAAFEADKERAKIVQEQFPDLRILGDLDNHWRDPEFDALVIATPTVTHFPLVRRALQEGKHVLVEKPLSRTVGEARELCRLAAERNLILMVGHIFLYNEAIQAARDTIQQKDFGTILYIRSSRLNLGPIRHDVNVLWDLAPHDISIFNHFYGALPVSVTCKGFRLMGTAREDMAQGTLEYPNGQVATFLVSWLDPKKERRVTVISADRMLTFDDMLPEKPLSMTELGINRVPSPAFTDTFESFRVSIVQGAHRELPVTTGRPLDTQCQEFVRCLLSGTPPVSDGRFGAEVVAILEALSESLASDSVTVPCDKYLSVLD